MAPPLDRRTKVCSNGPGHMTKMAAMPISKVCSNGPGHMTKMAAMPIYGKTLKNLLLRNQTADDLGGWYAALGARVLLSLFK